MVERERSARFSQSGEIPTVAAVPVDDARSDDSPDSISRECKEQNQRMAARIRTGAILLLCASHTTDSSHRTAHLACANSREHWMAHCKSSDDAARSSAGLSLESRTFISGVGDCHSDSLLRLPVVCARKSDVKKFGSQISLRADCCSSGTSHCCRAVCMVEVAHYLRRRFPRHFRRMSP